MKEHRILYFSLNENHTKGFYNWANKNEKCQDFCQIVKLKEEDLPPIRRVEQLQNILCQLENIDNLYVIIDYLSLFETNEELHDAADTIRRIILQFPEVDFLFDQSGVPCEWLNGIEFLLERPREHPIMNKICQGFHFFNRFQDIPFFFAVLDYDNLFDGTNLRWAVRNTYYEKLNVKSKNFDKLQDHRSENLVYVIDDEKRQSRFNSIALYSCGYRVFPIHTARMLLAVNQGIFKSQIRPNLIVRDFDLQFPDVEEKRDYYTRSKTDQIAYDFCNVILWDEKWRMNVKEMAIPRLSGYDKLIDYIRNYRYFEEDAPHWNIALPDDDSPFGINNLLSDKVYLITNGHDNLELTKHPELNVSTNTNRLIERDSIQVAGIPKPISGMYHPFFSNFQNTEGECILEKSFIQTRYDIHELDNYEIDKRRANHNHGVPINIYDTMTEMLSRANNYYKEAHYIKAAVLAQEAIEILNGFHLQMMILAYQIKAKAENAIAMDAVGADEDKLVYDALLRIEIVKQDIQRMLYPLFKSGSIKEYIKRRKKEHQLLEHIYSECRKSCHDNEYFDVESIYISAMAHLDEFDIGYEDLKRYLTHLWLLHKENKNKR